MDMERSSRLSPLTSEVSEEALDPRIQDELEKLNKASDDINKLELELDDERAVFRQTLSDTTHKLNVLAKRLGNCVEKARPYYEQRLKVVEAHSESQKAAIRFERACSMHEAAKEMVQLAEQGYMQGEDSTDPAWQEMLNHATMKVNEAERERNESEAEHRKAMLNFQKSDEKCHYLQKDLKRMITKSRPYFELKAAVNQQMEDNKRVIKCLEEDVQAAKRRYSEALRNLEKISDSIHQQRMNKKEQMELGERGAGVGSETPSPPPIRPKHTSTMDGQNETESFTDENPSNFNQNQSSEHRSSISQNQSTDNTVSASPNVSQDNVSGSQFDKSGNPTPNYSRRDSALSNQNVSSATRPKRNRQKGELILCVNQIMDPLAQTYQAESIQPTRKCNKSFTRPKTMPVMSPDSVKGAEFLNLPTSSSLTLPGSSIDDDRSDVESIASTGTMLDDDQVEFLTMEFSDMFKSTEDLSPRDEPHQVALPPKLSYLEKYVPNFNTSLHIEDSDLEFEAKDVRSDVQENVPDQENQK